MSEYGLTRLVLINSANYELAEIPLDDSVSIIGPNNAGKTSLINALQFLLISDRRQMDFGAHDEGATRRFYFPGPSSYVLLEAQLESGLVVLGCVGMGASHEYVHFAYSGSLRLEDFRKEDGTLVSQPDLAVHLSRRGVTVHFFKRSTDFFDALYAKPGKKGLGELDLCLYRLENTQFSKIFQRILVRTLRLDRLEAEDVKRFLLEIFQREYGSDVDFNETWHRAFDQVNRDRQQYQACVRLQKTIEAMEPSFQQRLVLRGKVAALRPLIDQALDGWEFHRQQRITELSETDRVVQGRIADSEARKDSLVEERIHNARHLEDLKSLENRKADLESRYSLIPDVSVLEDRLSQVTRLWEQANALLLGTEQGDLRVKQNRRDDVQRKISSLQVRLDRGESLLGTRLQGLLTPDEMDLLHGLVHSRILELPADLAGSPETFVAHFRRWVAQAGDELDVWGIRLDRRTLSLPFRQGSPEEMRQELAAEEMELHRLNQEIETIRDRGSQELRTNELRREVESERKALEEFRELESLRVSSMERKEENVRLQARQIRIEELRVEVGQQQDQLRQERASLRQERDDLDRKHQVIHGLRNQRRDGEALLTRLKGLRCTPWYSTESLDPSALDEALRKQSEDCRKLEDLDRGLRDGLHTVLLSGFTKFQGLDDEDEQIEKTIEFATHLDREHEVLQRHVMAAVTSVASALKELERQYEQFRGRLRGFNQQIGKRRLSDLERFQIDIQEHAYLLESIRTILRSSDAIEILESPDLFDVAHSGDDSVGNAALDRAKDQLLTFSKSQGSLKLEHLFGLQFEVAKFGQEPQRFDQLDKIGSNGTVLMAKLISGLALLHQMFDAKHKTRTVCYLDEAASLDDANQESLISTAREFGFSLLFASPTPQNTVRYCVPIEKRGKKNLVSRQHWQIFEELERT